LIIFETPPGGGLVGPDDVGIRSFGSWGIVGVVLRGGLVLSERRDWQ
jgi:hypothetical protein